MCGIVYWTGAAWMNERGGITQKISLNPVTVTGTVIQPVRRLPDRSVLVVEVTHVTREETTETTSGNLLLTWRNPDRSISQEDTIEASVRLRGPYGTRNPGGFHYGTYLKRKGIHAVATVSGPGKVNIVESRSSAFAATFRKSIDHWRFRIQEAAAVTFENPALGLFVGMIIGEQGFIGQETRDQFMATGTVHIISISGSHLGLIAFLTFFLVRGVVLNFPAPWLEWLSVRMTATRIAILVTLPLVSFYTLLAGAEVATVRSWIMVMVFLLAAWIGRERNILTVLALAAVMVLLHNPQALYDISFQLSYVAVLAIALVIKAAQEIRTDLNHIDQSNSGRVSWMWRGMSQTIWIALAVTLATLPIVAYHFNQIAWVGLLANLIVVPYVGFFVVPLGLTSAVWVLLTGAESLPLAVVNQTVLDGLVGIVRIFASIPGAEWYVGSPALLTMLVFYGSLILIISLPRSSFRWGCAMIALAILTLWIWSPRLGWDHNTLRVTFLDVGQGDATIIELPEGQTVLIDGGPAYARLDMGRAVVGPYLWDRGIHRIDHIIATHPQWDHVGGLPWVINTFEVGHYWSNGMRREKPFFQRVQKALEEAGLREEIAWEGHEILTSGPCSLKVLNPPARKEITKAVRTSPQGGTNLNNQSIVTGLDCGNHSFLFTADAEQAALWRLNQMPNGRTARVVKVPHHGAKSSLNRQWINGLHAEAAVISVGQHNRYDHPVQTVLDAYKKKKIPVYRTDQDGAVWFTVSLASSDLVVETAKQHALVPVQVGAHMWEKEWRNWKSLRWQWVTIV